MAAIIDYRGKSPNKTTFGVPLITAKVVKGGRIETPDEFIADADYEEWMSRGIPQAGDVVMTTEAPLGEVAQLDGRKVALAQRIITLRGKPGLLDQNFLKFLLQSKSVQEELRSRATGTTVVGIKQSELRKVNLTLPPYYSQKWIGHILGTLDDKIELNRRMNETLEAMARAIFQSWFVDFDPVRAKASGESAESICQRLGLTPELLALFPDGLDVSELGEIPNGWVIESIGTLANVTGGSTPNTKEPKYWDDGVHYWATPKDLSRLSSPVLLETERKVSDEGLAQIGSGLLKPGTVLLSSRAPIGYRAINEVPVAVNQGFIAMAPNSGVSKYFLLYWAEWAHDEIVSRANGSTFLEISKANFRPIPVMRPTDALFEKFDQYVGPLYKRIVSNEQETQLLVAQRDSLLPKLLSGEVPVAAEEEAS
jgi:type I restriction enzyme S subunit